MPTVERMLQSAAMKKTLQFDQQSCRLTLEGLPDLSSGQSADAIGILTGWSLAWVGRPEELEGRREHLQAIVEVVLPYARHLLSGVPKPFGSAAQQVEIAPLAEGGHQLLLRSSQPGVEPLTLSLDDAELADLVLVLDRLRFDSRLQLALNAPLNRPLRAREVQRRMPLPRRLSGVLGGTAALAVAGGVALLLPTPPAPKPAAPAAAPSPPPLPPLP
jgi:hypothetical protein